MMALLIFKGSKGERPMSLLKRAPYPFASADQLADPS